MDLSLSAHQSQLRCYRQFRYVSAYFLFDTASLATYFEYPIGLFITGI